MSDDMGYAPPKYAQIIAALRRRIADGTYPPGSALPSESQLIKEFGVARPTVVRALQAMQLRGEIVREHGRGSFVKAAPLTPEGEQAHPARTVLDDAEAGAGVRILHVGQVDAPEHVARLLGVVAGAPLLRRQRLGLRGELPCELVSLWASPEVARSSGLDQAEPLTAPVRQLVQAGTRTRLVHVVERLSARRPTAAEAKPLQISRTAPVFGVLASVLDGDGRAVLVVELVLPGELHDLEETYTL
ncbi:transcriptional regulator [Actinomadura sp. NBRC 104412]|uniref:GntR family transcriptional regulator n=1 Tax=Actinomadura sp. NBRC 104412 TaxID=3032203 RepID=UPI0024A3F000|nr:GntR family transcriptional regulator [Actinomadura sp. NBRC 104412]GLZ07660.1 transcriptional regulator [Actinomadura sp. NBRC 104412]